MVRLEPRHHRLALVVAKDRNRWCAARPVFCGEAMTGLNRVRVLARLLRGR